MGSRTPAPAARLGTTMALAVLTLIASALSTRAYANDKDCETFLAKAGITSDLAQQELTLFELFTFQSNADAPGFGTGKQIIKPTLEDLQEIGDAVQGDSGQLMALANEMTLYFNELPITTVKNAFDIVKGRLQSKSTSPKDVVASYKNALDITLHPQYKRAQAFPTSTDWGVTHELAVGLMIMHLKNPSLSFEQTRADMLQIERVFVDSKRLHQLQALQVYLSLKIANEKTSLSTFVVSLKQLQKDLAFNRKVVGFNDSEEVHPSLEEVLMLNFLAQKLNFTEADLIKAVQAIVERRKPETFKDIVAVISQAIARQQSQQAEIETPAESLPAASDDNGDS